MQYAKLLESKDYAVEIVNDGQECIEKYEKSLK